MTVWGKSLTCAASGIGLVALLAGCASQPETTTVETKPIQSAPPPLSRPIDLAATQREAVVAQTMLLVNTPYVWGGNTPDSGFDCSGLVTFVHKAVGDSANLPRTTAQWAKATVPITDEELKRGDLVFFNTSGKPFSHMGVYIGEGQFVHAPSSGGKVRTARLDNVYFAPRYQGARRLKP